MSQTEFNRLHDNGQSDSIPYFSFYKVEDDSLITGDISVSLDDNGQFDTITVTENGETTTYTRDQYTYTQECLYVLGIGFLLPGDIVKLKIDDIKEYRLGYGWHTNISSQTIYSWYLERVDDPEDYFYEERNGIFQSADLLEMNMENKEILTFYREFLDTIEVVRFRKDRISFNADSYNPPNF